jgi:antirestriction protein ArdC
VVKKTNELNNHVVTTKIIDEIRSENIYTWHRPWVVIPTRPMNFNNDHNYSLMNEFLLSLSMREQGFVIPNWITSSRGKRMGGTLKPDTKSTELYRWFPAWVDQNNKWYDRKPPKKVNAKQVFRFGYLNLYNVEQFTWRELPESFDHQSFDNPLVAESEVVSTVSAWLQPYLDKYKIKVEHKGGRAFYEPSKDRIVMPPMETFKSPTGYAQVLLHEAMHSTGHKERLNRFTKDNYNKRTEQYSLEELTAELGAAQTMHELNLPVDKTEWEGTVEYIRGWASKLEQSNEMFGQADARAKKARTEIMKWHPKTVEEKEQERADAINNLKYKWKWTGK